MTARAELEALHAAALAAVDGCDATERALAELPLASRRWTVLASGKAAAAMVEGAQRVLGDRIARGLATTRDEAEGVLGAVAVRATGHPLPDARSARAARAALALAARSSPDDGLLVLLSGGASALWSAPAHGLSLRHKRALTASLLRAGCPIAPLNAVRRHLSRIKGGGLLRAARSGEVVTLALSDVPGDAPEAIGSGPTAPDPSTYADALAALRELDGRRVPRALRAHLEAGAAGDRPETLAPDDPALARARYCLAGSLGRALAAARCAAEQRGWRVRDLGRALDGDVRAVALRLAEAARAARAEGIDVVVAGGEPRVVVRGPGDGGRAQELALEVALALAGEPGIGALLAATDGSDGSTSAAGAFVDGDFVRRTGALGIDVRAALARSDSHAVHAAAGSLFQTGPTRTNVADLALLRVQAPPGRLG